MTRLVKMFRADAQPGQPQISAAYRIDGTNLYLMGIDGSWDITAIYIDGNRADHAWLHNNGLGRATFPTRAQALRAFEAAAAVSPPPKPRSWSRLRRVAPGCYTDRDRPDITVTRAAPDQPWQIHGLGQRLHADTLTHAAVMIAVILAERAAMIGGGV